MTATPCVVDTSAWVEWLAGTTLGAQVAEHFPDKSRWIVPTLVQFELSKWLLREVGEDKADQVIAFSQKCVVVPLDTRIALLAVEMHREYKLVTADAIVYATARHHGATLLTCDAHFQGLPHVTCLAKTGSKD
ncbi:type II toxin-antitoxin system VapC family toxin [Acidithiobacillus caldus]|uniref:Ribonuclease VapC n=1 Tax=Acidithiobacillus caldus TaxID=33059 RepID=A0A1E7YMD4_9PROT|nr:type II toxin-antitoxin system VapC family toxin [Acidithiobacillus caldus]OFC35079.1 twitching motility protein PilT [Acidithiobacillus caldus]OFC36301.1 twitching motility protein PilT [Acidithiobacillus caldus]OFC40583.1 twitching motility protein PilT [Acidithiobacillus caldus]